MNKFKFNILSLGLIGALGMTSCADSFLDVSSKTESNTENFYKSETDAMRALIGCYDGWRQISSNPGIGFYVASTVMSDETFGGTGNGDDFKYQVIDAFNTSKSPSDMTLYTTDWKVYYAGVYRCNELMAHEEQIQWTSEATRGLYMGQARALRAILYFDMVRLWGNIPLFLEPVNENRAQVDPAEVYAAIFEDLKYAIANIPEDAKFADGDSGYINRYAAEALLARAYLFYSGYYGKDPGFTNEAGETTGVVTKADALAAVEDVISSGKYSLVDDFKNLWPASSLVPIPNSVGWDTEKSTYAGDQNSEIILAQRFTPTQDYDGNNDSNRWLVMMGMRQLNATPYGKGWGACTISPVFIEKYLDGDPRFTPSVIDLVGEGLAQGNDFNSSFVDWREYTGYTIKKYSPLVYGNGLPGTNSDGTAGFQECNANQWVIMRYADVLLMAAELGSSNASTYMHLVRSRAGLDDIAVTQQNIMDERARELAFEGHRYWDLLRQGVDVAADAIAASSAKVFNGGVESTVSYDRSLIIATKGLSQIPEDQITLSNGVLKQNPGWTR
ncbi:RagB/SusD family nutrient uptake outer membrane protein [uncultured Duncaniella sp.]|uniref:RagB/SusD family nutrient uptake outer membrane protein n=1 Tax=uncultured Duncaniella sp. TaxID=2768039 RepID=UPI0025D84F5D|nr:RagB/SusD family nutrient uptake outer membrane protein [uncultured Duncaniella sp.]